MAGEGEWVVEDVVWVRVGEGGVCSAEKEEGSSQAVGESWHVRWLLQIASPTAPTWISTIFRFTVTCPSMFVLAPSRIPRLW